jgi:hypothetical protein
MRTNVKNQFLYSLLASFSLAFSFAQVKSVHAITVKNTLDKQRSFETVEIYKANLTLKSGEDFSKLKVQDKKTKGILVSQFVDTDQDGTVDLLLFQPEIKAKSQKKFQLVLGVKNNEPVTIDYCYSRFVPERTDDYAWENNRVAFRTYGPTAQKMIEESVKGGTLSSGIDAWCKRVDYPIINKWYEKATKQTGAYHKDSGEGLDNFHVGVSRGVGGIAVKKDGTYYVSKNFTNWKTITTGPIRTSFVLEYANWDANGQIISEKKYISLDYGNNLSKFEIEVSGTNTINAGITLHEKAGVHSKNEAAGWISYWEPIEDSELGTALVVPNKNMISTDLYSTTVKDQSNFYSEIKVNNRKAIYYVGFGWKKSKQFETKESWEHYLNEFALKSNNPLIISIK